MQPRTAIPSYCQCAHHEGTGQVCIPASGARGYQATAGCVGANLLLFIAFDCTIGNDLPRPGCLTFMDTFLVTAFVITSVVFLLAVYMKRMETDAKQQLAHRIDARVMWLYPAACPLGTTLTLWIYAWPPVRNIRAWRAKRVVHDSLLTHASCRGATNGDSPDHPPPPVPAYRHSHRFRERSAR